MRTAKIIKPLQIGKLTLKNNLVLAPMAGYGDVAFRRLCRDFGAGLTVTEMISAKGLLHDSEKTVEMLRLAPNETPSCVQLFGSDPDDFAACMARREIQKFDIIDINMGCPVKKIVSNGEGSALLKDFDRAAAIVQACVKNTDKPVTVKFRVGYAENERLAAEFAVLCEGAGAAMVAVHGRTTAQQYTGRADWEEIERAAAAVSIPVLGNGDIRSATDVYHRLSGSSSLSGVMVGRGALGRPDVFAGILGGESGSLKQVILKHIDYMLEYFPSAVAAVNMRKHLAMYLKGVPNTRELRQKVNDFTDAAALRQAVQDYLP